MNELAVTHMRATLLVGVIAAAFTADMNAIVIRHDRDEARYRALGQDTPAVVRFAAGGMGTLIAAQWILTAAHVAEHLNVGASVNVDGVIRRVTAVTSHPEYSMQNGADIALVRLDAAVQARPIPLHTNRDETGKTVTFIGEGDFGTGSPVRCIATSCAEAHTIAWRGSLTGGSSSRSIPGRTRKTSKASAARATAAVPPCSPAMG